MNRDKEPETYAEQIARRQIEERSEEAFAAAERSTALAWVGRIVFFGLFLDGLVFWLFLGAVLFGDKPASFLIWPVLAASAIVVLAFLVAAGLGLRDGLTRKRNDRNGFLN